MVKKEVVDQIRKEYEDRITNLKMDRLTYCAYCGEEFPIDAKGTPEAVSEHIRTCFKHPMSQAVIAERKRIGHIMRLLESWGQLDIKGFPLVTAMVEKLEQGKSPEEA